MTTTTWLFALAAIAVGMLVLLVRRLDDERRWIEPILKEQGLTFVASRTPGFFDVGPFPKLEFHVGGHQNNFMGISGEYRSYRIVTFHDAGGRERVSWACLEHDSAGDVRIRWLPPLNEFVADETEA